MRYELKCWPDSVPRREIDSLPVAARAAVKAALLDLAREGPSPSGRNVKCLGKSKDGIWQLNLKANKEQIRLLYFPHGGRIIVLVSAFKKTSKQLQEREYETAMSRKKEAERRLDNGDNDGLSAIT